MSQDGARQKDDMPEQQRAQPEAPSEAQLGKIMQDNFPVTVIFHDFEGRLNNSLEVEVFIYIPCRAKHTKYSS